MEDLIRCEKQLAHKQAIREILESGERISVKSIWLVLKTTELRHFLSQLRKEGLIILDKWTYKGDIRFKEYWIERGEVVKP